MQEAEYHDCKSANTFSDIIICESCQTILGNEEDMEKHQCHNTREENITSLFTCPDCPKSFSLITMLQKHQNSHRTKKTLNQKLAKEKKKNDKCEGDLNHCSVCNTTFSSQKNLKWVYINF